MFRRCSLPLSLAGSLLLAACGGGFAPESERDGELVPAPRDDVAGGQTGSASCGPEPDCVCDVAARALLARGTVTVASDSELELRVEEVFTPDTRLMVGDVLSAPYQTGLPCGQNITTHIAAGSDVLLAFEAEMLSVVPWQPLLTLAEDVTLPREDVDLLLDTPACRAHFTPDAPRDCAPTAP